MYVFSMYESFHVSGAWSLKLPLQAQIFSLVVTWLQAPSGYKCNVIWFTGIHFEADVTDIRKRRLCWPAFPAGTVEIWFLFDILNSFRMWLSDIRKVFRICYDASPYQRYYHYFINTWLKPIRILFAWKQNSRKSNIEKERKQKCLIMYFY